MFLLEESCVVERWSEKNMQHETETGASQDVYNTWVYVSRCKMMLVMPSFSKQAGPYTNHGTFG